MLSVLVYCERLIGVSNVGGQLGIVETYALFLQLPNPFQWNAKSANGIPNAQEMNRNAFSFLTLYMHLQIAVDNVIVRSH